LFLWKSK